MKYAHILTGKCHCGNIYFTFETNKDIKSLIPRECQCTLCRRHGASYTSDPEGSIKLHFKDRDLVSYYRFGHSTSDFIICRKCGVLVMAICDIQGRTRAVINIKSMLDYGFPSTRITTNFDKETVEERLARRARNWTGHVTVSSS